MEEIRARLTAIKDPRHQSYVKYPLADILIIIMCAVLCGLDKLGDLVIYEGLQIKFENDVISGFKMRLYKWTG